MRAPELLLALLAVLCAGCQAPSDRTERIDWHYLWDTDDPVAKISEKYVKGGMPQHGAVRSLPLWAVTEPSTC